MSSITPSPARDDDVDGPRFTVEDAGTTTDAGTLVNDDDPRGSSARDDTERDGTARNDTLFHNDTGAGSAAAAYTVTAEDVSTAPADQVQPDTRDDRIDAVAGVGDAAGSNSTGSTAPSGGLASLIGDDSVAHVFDQTNGVIDGLEGDSDGTADSDAHAATDRAD